MQDFKKLKVWERSHNLALRVYAATSHFPKAELYGLTSQIRRSSVSIPANIAEGSGRNSAPDFSRFVFIAFGSASELEYYLMLSHDLKPLSKSDYDQLANDVTDIKRMLSAFVKKLKTDN